MKIAICDDNIKDAKILKSIIENYIVDHKIIAKIDLFIKSSDLINRASEYRIIILDIVMGRRLGMDIASEIHCSNPTTPIIFYSSNMEYAPDTYDSFGSGFLLKPPDKRKVYKCLNRLMKSINENKIKFKAVNDISYNVYINDIEYIKSEGKYTFVKMKNKKIKCRKLLKEWINDLDVNYFLLCKRGLLVNAHYVNGIDAFDNLILKDGRKIKLTRELGENFKVSLAQYWADDI